MDVRGFKGVTITTCRSGDLAHAPIDEPGQRLQRRAVYVDHSRSRLQTEDAYDAFGLRQEAASLRRSLLKEKIRPAPWCVTAGIAEDASGRQRVRTQ